MYPLVFLHGFLGNACDWEPVCSLLSKHQCICPNLPGHGGAPFAEEIQINLPRFHLIGYSMGGRIAADFAKKHPEKIASLTLISTHPGLKSADEKKLRLQSDQKWAELLLHLPIDDFLTRWYDQLLFKTFKPDLTVRREQNPTELAKALLHFSLSKQPFFQIEDPIVGALDEKFRALYKNPILIPHSGHVVHLENPTSLAKIIEQKISK